MERLSEMIQNRDDIQVALNLANYKIEKLAARVAELEEEKALFVTCLRTRNTGCEQCMDKNKHCIIHRLIRKETE